VAVDRFKDLFVVLEDLIKRVADTDDPKIRNIRAKVRADLLDLENDMTPISACSCPRPVSGSIHVRRDKRWGQPALAALTGVAVALTLLRNYGD